MFIDTATSVVSDGKVAPSQNQETSEGSVPSDLRLKSTELLGPRNLPVRLACRDLDQTKHFALVIRGAARREDKERENAAALEVWPDLLREMDALPPEERLASLVQGVRRRRHRLVSLSKAQYVCSNVKRTPAPCRSAACAASRTSCSCWTANSLRA